MSQIENLLNSFFEIKGNSPQLWITINNLLINKKDESLYFCSYMKNKLNDFDKDIQILCLDLLDYLIDENKMFLWTQISKKDFLNNLINILKNKNEKEVQIKILFLFEKWGKKFEEYFSILPNFTSYYINLKNHGINFPKNIKSNYFIYINQNNNFKNSNQLNIKLNIGDYDKKYRKLVIKINDWVNLINEINIMLDQSVKENLNENLIYFITELNNADKTLIENIQSERLKDEKLMEISLLIVDEMKKNFKKI